MRPAPRALIHNWRLKVSALVLSILLWALVQNEPGNRETFSAVPVRVDVSDTAWALAEAPIPATVELRLGGPAREIIRLAREGTSVRVPIPSVGSADTVVTLRREWVTLDGAGGVTIESVSPATVSLRFEPAEARLLPLAMRLLGRIPDDRALASGIVLTPEFVRVRGAEGRVSSLDSVPLRPFDLGRVTRSGIYTVPIDTAGLGGASVSPAAASLGVRLEERVERTLEAVPVLAVAPEGEPAVVPEPRAVSLTLAGARSLVTELDPATLRVSVEPALLEGMVPGEVRRVLLRVEGVPAFVTAVAEPDFVTVRRAADVPAEDGR